MGQRMIRLDDEVYTELQSRADEQGRSYANLANYLLKREFGLLGRPDEVVGETKTAPTFGYVERTQKRPDNKPTTTTTTPLPDKKMQSAIAAQKTVPSKCPVCGLYSCAGH